MKVQHSSLPPTSAPSRSLSPCRHHNAPAVTHAPAAAVHEHPPQDLAHSSSTPAEHNPSEAHREPPNWQRGPRANQKKPAHGKKSKNPSPGLSPRVLHEPTYSADERCQQHMQADVLCRTNRRNAAATRVHLGSRLSHRSAHHSAILVPKTGRLRHLLSAACC